MEPTIPEAAPKGTMWLKILIAVLIIGVVAYGFITFTKKPSVTADQSHVPVTTPAPDTSGGGTPVPTPGTASVYKDGTYSAVGNYFSPEGAESINVTLTIKNDIVTDANVISNAFRPESKQYQGRFIYGYKAEVIGKKLSDLNLTRVSGSSLTPGGFDDAVAKIRTQAKA